MGATQSFTNQAKQDFLSGVHNIATDTFKLALYDAATSNLSKATTTYSTTGELAEGNGYTRGGAILSQASAVTAQVGLSGDTAYLDFTVNPSWTGASFTCDAASIYNASKGNKVLATFYWTPAVTVNNGAFLAEMPAPGVNAVIRIA